MSTQSNLTSLVTWRTIQASRRGKQNPWPGHAGCGWSSKVSYGFLGTRWVLRLICAIQALIQSSHSEQFSTRDWGTITLSCGAAWQRQQLSVMRCSWHQSVGQRTSWQGIRESLLPPAPAFRWGYVRGLGLRTLDKGLLFTGLNFHWLTKPKWRGRVWPLVSFGGAQWALSCSVMDGGFQPLPHLSEANTPGP